MEGMFLRGDCLTGPFNISTEVGNRFHWVIVGMTPRGNHMTVMILPLVVVIAEILLLRSFISCRITDVT